MHTTHDSILSWGPGARPASLWLLLVLMVPCVAPSHACAAPVVASTPRPTRVAVASLPVATWYDTVWRKIVNQLNNRTGAIQFGLIGMLIALWIIWWRK